MKVKIVGQMTLVDDVSKFYELKKLGQCPLCNAGIQTTIEQRRLTAQCAPGCTNNVAIPVPRVTTYDRKLDQAKATLDATTAAVLQAKFDFLFQHSKEKSLEDLKLDYLRARQAYTDMSSAYTHLTRAPDVRADLKALRADSGRPDKKREWCARYKRLTETMARVQTLKYKGATEVADMMPYTWAELEVKE